MPAPAVNPSSWWIYWRHFAEACGRARVPNDPHSEVSHWIHTVVLHEKSKFVDQQVIKLQRLRSGKLESYRGMFSFQLIDI